MAQGKHQADQDLFTLAFHVNAAIRQCDMEIERLRDTAPAGALALHGVRDTLTAAVRGLPPSQPLPVPTAEPTARELARALKVCGLLSVVLSRKVLKLRRADRPNVVQIADEAIGILEAEFPDTGKLGLGLSSVRQTLTAGLKALDN